MIKIHFILFFTLLQGWFNPVAFALAKAETPPPTGVVHAVLFYSPNCGHCHYVITEVLPPLAQKYGERLQMIGIDVSQQGGQVIFKAALDKFGVDTGYIPFLVIGDTYLVGSGDIPQKFPGLIEQYLAKGGVDWPAIPGLAEVLASAENADSPTASPATAAPPTVNTGQATPVPSAQPIEDPAPTATPIFEIGQEQNTSLGEKLARDPQGNMLSILVLIGMLLSVLLAILFFRQIRGQPLTSNHGWLIPLLCLLGLGVAGYLAYVETTQVKAVCGPIGDCNAVQQSGYARLFGILPIGVLGLAGYLAILFAWSVGRFARPRPAALASLALLGMTSFGILFSIYLTFLEPFVIGATCAWCLTAAILMTALFWLSLAPGRHALDFILDKKQKSQKHEAA